MAETTIVESGPGLEDLKKRILEAAGYVVKVGVLGGEPKDETETTVAQVAFWNEFGTLNEDGTQRIPPRPAFRQGAEASRDGLKKLARTQARGVVEGKRTARQALGVMGAFVQGKIQNSIVDLKSPPNAESTIKAKKSSNPLVDDGQLKNSISFSVERLKAGD